MFKKMPCELIYMSFSCKRCNEKFTRKDVLIKHLKRKTPCIIHNQDIDRDTYLTQLVVSKNICFECKYCGKNFTRNNNRYSHQKRCEQPNQDIEIIEDSDTDYEGIQEREQLIKIIKNFQKQLEEKKRNITNNITNNINNINVTQNIYINNYGEEKLDDLKDKIINNFLKINLPKLIRDIHYNPDVPENMNICYVQGDDSNNRESYIKKKINNRWVKVPLPDGINELIIDKARILENLPKTHDLMNDGYCNKEDIVCSLDELYQIKASAIKQEHNELYDEVYLRLHKENQKAIARDANLDEPYCFVLSNSSSDQE